MSNLYKAMRIIARRTGKSDPYLITASQTAEELQRVGLLAPDTQVITTMEELRQFDEYTVFMNDWGDLFDVNNVQAGMKREDFPYYFPCAVVASGEQVRAAGKALEEDNGK